VRIPKVIAGLDLDALPQAMKVDKAASEKHLTYLARNMQLFNMKLHGTKKTDLSHRIGASVALLLTKTTHVAARSVRSRRHIAVPEKRSHFHSYGLLMRTPPTVRIFNPRPLSSN
jgi:hypothetical protein